MGAPFQANSEHKPAIPPHPCAPACPRAHLPRKACTTLCCAIDDAAAPRGAAALVAAAEGPAAAAPVALATPAGASAPP